MAGHFLAGNLFAHGVTFGDFMVRNFMSGDILADALKLYDRRHAFLFAINQRLLDKPNLSLEQD